LLVPSAFTPQTGRDHWEVLLRARAIENQCFVVAAAQFGQHGPARASHGRSLIIDPWGLILAQAPDRPCVIVADCDPDSQQGIRTTLPALLHRRL
jgi:predicted amidohydrolase